MSVATRRRMLAQLTRNRPRSIDMPTEMKNKPSRKPS
jgi:hypothetical protein